MADKSRSANLAVLQAKEDTAQARAGRLPSVNAFNQFIYTEGNGTPSGVFVANDGVHVYNEQAVVHEELLSLVRHGELNRALAAEAVARAKVDVAARGLNATVIQDYYAIVGAQRKPANAQTSLTRSATVCSTSPRNRSRRRSGACRRDQSPASICSSASAICRKRSSPSKKPRSRWAS